ncbi:MAG: hypothetical protein IIC06_06090, partial [Proteobacteria bacterium]|nr:hypothetical protein [Pseudomonadota bacterium]
MGDRKIKSHRIPSLAAVLAPLVLAGCGMPVGVQIASLFADGLSFLATEKTLGDHGLSAVAGQDCAVWRGLNGEKICRDNGAETAANGTEEQASASSPSDVAVDTMEDAYVWESDEPKTPPKPTEVAAVQEPSWTNPDPTAVTEAPAAPPPVPPMTAPSVSMRPVPPVPPVAPVAIAAANPAATAPKPAARVPGPTPTETTLKGGTFYVIASYRRLGYARRFASGQEDLAAKVLMGTARGLTVYRVAVGPVAKADRPGVRDRLLG